MVCLTGDNPSETPYTRDCSHRAKQFELKLCILFCLIGLTLGFSGISRLYIFVCLFVLLLFLVGNLFGFENIFGRQSKGVYLFIPNAVKSPYIEQIYVVSFLITRSKLYCLYNVHNSNTCLYILYTGHLEYSPTSKHYFCRKKNEVGQTIQWLKKTIKRQTKYPQNTTQKTNEPWLKTEDELRCSGSAVPAYSSLVRI